MSEPRCNSCGKVWVEHMGCEGMCAENKRLRAELDEAREAARSILCAEFSICDCLHRWPWLKEE